MVAATLNNLNLTYDIDQMADDPASAVSYPQHQSIYIKRSDIHITYLLERLRNNVMAPSRSYQLDRNTFTGEVSYINVAEMTTN